MNDDKTYKTLAIVGALGTVLFTVGIMLIIDAAPKLKRFFAGVPTQLKQEK